MIVYLAVSPLPALAFFSISAYSDVLPEVIVAWGYAAVLGASMLVAFPVTLYWIWLAWRCEPNARFRRYWLAAILGCSIFGMGAFFGPAVYVYIANLNAGASDAT